MTSPFLPMESYIKKEFTSEREYNIGDKVRVKIDVPNVYITGYASTIVSSNTNKTEEIVSQISEVKVGASDDFDMQSYFLEVKEHLEKLREENKSIDVIPDLECKDSDDYESTATVVCKHLATEELLMKWKESQLEKFTSEGKIRIMPVIDRVVNICRSLYVGKTVYCIHLDYMHEFGGNIVPNLTWICSQHIEQLCTDEDHGGADPERRKMKKRLDYACYLLAY